MYRLIFIALLLTATACSTLPTPQQTPLSDWQKHVERQQQLNQWQLSGKLAFRSPDESNTASLSWQQQPHQYQMRLSGILGIGTTYIEGDSTQVTLRRGKQQTVASDSAQLTTELLGIPLSVEDLTYWVRGIPATNAAIDNQQHGDLGTLQHLQQRGWQLEFSRYGDHNGWLLPGKITGTRGELSFKLIIKDWKIEPATEL